jgi:hypothetical protein
MKSLHYSLTIASLTGSIALLSWLPCQSCCALPREPRQGSLPSSITLDQQSAFLWQSGGKEHMLLSVKYSGTTDEFAWVIPVESRPTVTVEKGAPFTELRRLTEVAVRVKRASMDEAMAPGGAPPPSVTVLERKEEGPYDLAVLSATSGGGLYLWLKQNGFHLSKNARGHLNYYVDKKYVFVAARIRSGAKGNEAIAQRLKQGTIAPMHLAFAAKELTYPLKVTAANPGMSAMELYVAGPVDPHRAKARRDPMTPRNDTGLRQETFQIKAQGKQQFTISGPPGTVHSQGDFPTLRRLLPKGGQLTKFTATMSDADRQEDLVFAKL